MYQQHATLCPIEPGEHEYVVANREVSDAIRYRIVEYQPSTRCPFESLLGRCRLIDKGGLDVPDGPDHVVGWQRLAPRLRRRPGPVREAGTVLGVRESERTRALGIPETP